MFLGAFSVDGVHDFGVYEAASESFIALSQHGIGSDITDFIASGASAVEVAGAIARDPAQRRVPRTGVRLEAPIPKPRRNIMCVGKNYYEHAHEFHNSGFDSTAAQSAIPEVPIIFTKAPTSVIAPGDAICAANDPTGSVDYEGELAVIIGTGGRSIGKSDAYAHVFGYTIVNDVTSRTLQSRHKQWFLGKSIDTFCPMGPFVVTADAIGDVSRLRLQTFVNDELRQDALVADLIFDIPTLIETISSTMTLEPGDIIATGTPAGVGIGFTPPKFLAAGDHVRIVLEPIGELANPVA